MNPKLIINLFKLRTNLDRLVDRCHAVGIKTAIVTKVFCADERICRMISESEADAFADSRVQNLAAIAELHSDKPTQLLRISSCRIGMRYAWILIICSLSVGTKTDLIFSPNRLPH